MNAFSITDHIQGRNSQKVLAELLAWQNDVFSEILNHKPGLASELKFSGRVPLGHLPHERQIQYMGRYRKIIGFDEAMDTLGSGADARSLQIQNIAARLRQMRSNEDGNGYWKFPTNYQNSDNVLDAIYSQLNVSQDEIFRPHRAGIKVSQAARAGHSFTFGINSIPTIDALGMNMPSRLNPGTRLMTFDIETAGLMRNQIREVAYSSGIVGAAQAPATNQLLFSPRLLGRGVMGMENAAGNAPAVSIQDYLAQRFGQTNVSSSDEFATRMVPFLNEMRQADAVMGHNIAHFDIRQVFQQLSSTSAYLDESQSVIPGFRQLVDETFQGLQGKIIDTLTLAQRATNLGDIEVAPELLRRGEARPYSIENLLLQTNLAEKIGPENLRAVMGSAGLHHGEVDDLVTRALYEHMESLELTPLADGDIRNRILSSAAITPFTNARSWDEISDPALRKIIASVDAGLRSGPEPGFGINPIEQQIIGTRRLGLGLDNVSDSVDPGSVIYRSNLYDQMAYEGLPRDRDYASPIMGQNVITQAQMENLQNRFARNGGPWAGLSLEERRFGTALSHLTSGLTPGTMGPTLTELASDSMVSHFRMFDPTGDEPFEYLARTGRPTLPGHLIKDFVGGDVPSMLSLSVVDPTELHPDATVNLVYHFDDAAASERFAQRLENLNRTNGPINIGAALGIDIGDETSTVTQESPRFLTAESKFRTAVGDQGLAQIIRETGHTAGVTIGQLNGPEAEGVISLLKELNGVDELTSLADDKMLAMKLPFQTMLSTGQYGEGLIRTSGAVLDRFMTNDEVRLIGKEVSRATRVFDAYTALGERQNRFLLEAALTASEMGHAGKIAKMYDAWQNIRGNAPKYAGIAAVGALGLLLLKRHQEVDQYQEVLDPMPTENRRYGVADKLQAKMDMGVNKAYQRYDPMATTYVVDSLYQNRVQHSQMAWDKDTNLYGGVL